MLSLVDWLKTPFLLETLCHSHGTEGSNAFSGNTKSVVLGDRKDSWEPFHDLEGLSAFSTSSRT